MTKPCTLEEISKYLETNDNDELFDNIKISDFVYRLQNGKWEDPENQLDDAMLTAHCHKVMGEWIDLEKDHELSLED